MSFAFAKVVVSAAVLFVPVVGFMQAFPSATDEAYAANAAGDIDNIRAVQEIEYQMGNGYITDLTTVSPSGFEIKLSAGSAHTVIADDDGYAIVSTAANGDVLVSTATETTEYSELVTAGSLGELPVDPASVAVLVNENFAPDNEPSVLDQIGEVLPLLGEKIVATVDDAIASIYLSTTSA